MKNDDIIAQAAIEIYGEEAVKEMLESGKGVPVHTLMGWKQINSAYRVKKGEHGIEVRLWKKRKKKENTNEDGNAEEDGDGFYKVKSFLFTFEQVEIYEEGMP